MITTAAYLLVPGDLIQHRGNDFTVTHTAAAVDEADPRIYVLVTHADGRRYRLNLRQLDYVARHEGAMP